MNGIAYQKSIQFRSFETIETKLGFLPEWQKKHNQLLKFQISHCVMIPPAQRSCCWGGVYWFLSVRLSVPHAVPLCNSYSSGSILSILGTNDH